VTKEKERRKISHWRQLGGTKRRQVRLDLVIGKQRGTNYSRNLLTYEMITEYNVPRFERHQELGTNLATIAELDPT
jgi:hypothetical protein